MEKHHISEMSSRVYFHPYYFYVYIERIFSQAEQNCSFNQCQTNMRERTDSSSKKRKKKKILHRRLSKQLKRPIGRLAAAAAPDQPLYNLPIDNFELLKTHWSADVAGVIEQNVSSGSRLDNANVAGSNGCCTKQLAATNRIMIFGRGNKKNSRRLTCELWNLYGIFPRNIYR